MKKIELFVVFILFTCSKFYGKGLQWAKNDSVIKPNIILIMSDDMGYSDIGCYGGEIDTPNLDALAKSGLRFTQFYNGARCCPTRAPLLTGLYPHQTGIGLMTNSPENPHIEDLGLPGYRGFLNKKSVTLAEVLKTAGYTTLMTGKWHVGFLKKEQWPLQRGFDKFYGVLAGATNYFKPEYPRGITLNNDTISITDPDYYTTDAFTDYGIKFIDESVKDGKKPFFLYLAYNAPHWPLEAPKEDIDKYRGKYNDGWKALREKRFKKMKELGILDDSWDLSPQDSDPWDSLSPGKRKEMSHRREIYSAQVDRMDQNIGRLVNYLKKNDLYDNTVIFFIDDNGACAEGGMLGGGPKKQLETKRGYFLTYGQAWANASSTPFRKYKHWVHEGGMATPLIAHWPEGIAQKDEGKIVREYGFLPDIMATLVDLSGATYPTMYKGNKIAPLEGESMLPLFKGGEKPIHTKPVFWEHEGNKAVRLGKYKLVMEWLNKKDNHWELYDMEKDRTEVHDLAQKMPKRVRKMSKMWMEWAATHQVEPRDRILKLHR